jgi:hypothetical protein
MPESDRHEFQSIGRAAGSQSKRAAGRVGDAAYAVAIARHHPEMLDPASILQLQKTAGNTALAMSFQPRYGEADTGQLPRLQRYEAGEHAQFGARKGEKEEVFTIEGIRVTYGEMIAMADVLESPDKIHAFAKLEWKEKGKDGKETGKKENALQHLVDLVRQDKAARQPGGRPPGGKGTVPDSEWEDATSMLPDKEHYLEVTGRNTGHFGPPSSTMKAPTSGTDHKTQWSTWHMHALDLAKQGKREDALEATAFGDHFLTDAFSAGHLFNKPQIMALTKQKIDKQVGYFTLSLPFTDKIAKGILADSTAAARLNLYQVRTWGLTDDWYDMNSSSLSKVILGVYTDKDNQEKFLGLYANAVHNRLNGLLETDKVGVKVKNKMGKDWPLSGDKTLALSGETLEYGREAVAQSRQNVLDAVAAGAKSPPDPKAMIDKVWAWVPEPTPEGQTMIDQAIATYTNPDDPKTVKAVTDVSVGNIDIMIEKLTSPKINRLRLKTVTPATAPVPAPAPTPTPVPQPAGHH